MIDEIEIEKENILKIAKNWQFDDKIINLLKSFFKNTKFIYKSYELAYFQNMIHIVNRCEKCNAWIHTYFYKHNIDNCDNKDVTRFLEQDYYVCDNCINLLIKKQKISFEFNNKIKKNEVENEK